MQFTDLPQNTSGVLYQNDSPRHFWSRFRLRVRLVHARAHTPSFSTLLRTQPTKRLLGL